ncbi:hypothetical protein GEMRC1_005981 [Eukaryota sp. GEM-RC1]
MEFVPSVMTTMEGRIGKARMMTAHNNGRFIEVTDERQRIYIVDLDQQNCDCGRWQTEAILCIHACMALMSVNSKPLENVDECFARKTQSKIYESWVVPPRDRSVWTSNATPLSPPDVKRGVGAPKKKRHRSVYEF